MALTGRHGRHERHERHRSQENGGEQRTKSQGPAEAGTGVHGDRVGGHRVREDSRRSSEARRSDVEVWWTHGRVSDDEGKREMAAGLTRETIDDDRTTFYGRMRNESRCEL